MIVAVAAAAVVVSAPATRAVHGVVFVDVNRDGVRGADEPVVPDAVVGAGTIEVVAGDDGRFAIAAVPGQPIWARAFDGFAAPGPWVIVPAAGGAIASEDVALGLVPAPRIPDGAAWSFVVASDAHLRADDEAWSEVDLGAVIDQATARDPRPRFVAIAGDLTQHGTDDEATAALHAFATAAAPLVPVAGNHDWYDAGLMWRARFGPDLYSFDLGGVHVVVIDSMRPVAALTAFVAADLATAPPDARVIAFTHGPPEFELVEVLDGLGVDEVFAGHWHVNRTLHRADVDHLVEYDTEPAVMGGMDQSPAGYRVVEVRPDGVGGAALRVRHEVVVDGLELAVVGPAPGQCAPPGQPIAITVAAAGRAVDGVDVQAIDQPGAVRATLRSIGGWDFVGALPAMAPGRHPLRLRAGGVARDAIVDVCDAPVFEPGDDDAWTQLGGGPGRTNAIARALPQPLIARWTAAVGGHLGAGSPVIARGLVFVAPFDLADDATAAVVALDLATGVERWRVGTGAAVKNALAIAGDVVVAAADDGVVWGLDADSGRVRWRVDLARGVLPEHATTWGAPLVVGDAIFVGNQRAFARLDAATGAIRWQIDPVPDTDGGGSFASPTWVDGMIVTVLNRALSGVQGWDPATGAMQWMSIDICSLSAAPSPVTDGAIAWMISGATHRCTVDGKTGYTQLFDKLDQDSFEWSYEAAATPAVGAGTLVAVTQWGLALAYDTAEPRKLRWKRAIGGPARIHAAHYRGTVASIAGSPVIAGDVAWIATADGDVVAVDLHDGHERARLPVGAPILSGPAIAGDALVVASFDGTVRLYAAIVPHHRRWRWPAVGAGAIAGAVIALWARGRRGRRRRRGDRS